MPFVEFHQTGGLGRITLNDPDRLNAMSEPMAEEFSALVNSLSLKSELRAIILTGAGRAFSAGGDLAMLLAKHQLDFDENRRRMLVFYRSFLCMRELNLPLIAAINGHAVGAGFCLAAACDLRVADPSARFSAPFARLGLFPGMGATHFLPRAVGTATASDLMLTGRMIKADEALRLGLVARLSEPGQVLEEASKMANDILAGGPEAIAEVLSSLRGDPALLEAALSREAEAQARSYARDEFVEGVRAVQEKRAARW